MKDLCLSFHFFVSRLGTGGRYLPSLSFCFDLLVLPVYRLGNVCVTECNSSCLVFQFAAVSSTEHRFNVAGRSVIV